MPDPPIVTTVQWTSDLCFGAVSANTNPGVDDHTISTGFVGLRHLLEIFNMLGIWLPTNGTDLQVLDLIHKKKV